ncbi:MAG: hypothetical protein ABI840_08155 [bacterium]
MMKLKILVIFSIIIFSNIKSYSQEINSGGSPYSVFGLGDLIYYSSPRTYSMGITGTSLFGNYINNLNPATISKLNATTISIDANYGFLKSTSEANINEVSNGNVLGFNIGIPFDQGRGWVLALGFNPVTFINYRIRQSGSTGGQSFTQTYSGKGGLSRINIGMSYNLFQKISIGLEYNYGFGEVKNQNFINFNNPNYTNTNFKNQYDFQKSFLKGGIVFEVGKIINSFTARDLAVGFFYQSGINLDATRDGIFSSSLSIDTVRLNTGQIEFPEIYGFGITNIFANKYIVSGDLVIQDWNKYKLFGQTNQNFQKSYRAGIGLEVEPNPDGGSFWQLLTYRVGGFYEKAFYKLSGQDVNTIGLRTGVNIPISQYNSIDFGISYSIKGKTESGLIKDEFLNFTAGINFGELWFLRPRDEDQ